MRLLLAKKLFMLTFAYLSFNFRLPPAASFLLPVLLASLSSQLVSHLSCQLSPRWPEKHGSALCTLHCDGESSNKRSPLNDYDVQRRRVLCAFLCSVHVNLFVTAFCYFPVTSSFAHFRSLLGPDAVDASRLSSWCASSILGTIPQGTIDVLSRALEHGQCSTCTKQINRRKSTSMIYFSR